MEKKLDVIKDAIQKYFPGAEIDYQYAIFELHKFRIKGKEHLPWCWLYFDWAYFEDHDEQEILERLRITNVFETLSNASKPIWILVTELDVKEVNESFIEGH